MQDKQVLIFHKEEFQLPAASCLWEMMENANIILYLLKSI